MVEQSQTDMHGLRRLIERLTAAGAFGDAPAQTIETHISVLVLGEQCAWKFKKPVDLGFVDFTTLARRRQACEAEVALNSRLLPEYYLGVVPVGGTPAAPRLGIEPAHEVCVKMRRFPAEAELPRALADGHVTAGAMRRLGRELADFHERAALARLPGSAAAAFAAHCDDNVTTLRTASSDAQTQRDLDALSDWLHARLEDLAPLLDDRQRRGRVRQGHGDLHAGNMLLLDGRVRAFDCIEFSESLRSVDVLNDLAFALMDLEHRGYARLAAELLDAYLEAGGDYDGMPLLPLFCCYRAMVRAKVAALQIECSDDRLAAQMRERRRRYLALASRYAGPARGTLILTHGFSGSGKSTLAATLTGLTGAVRVRSDVERKRLLHGIAKATTRTPKVYGPEMTQQTYARLAAACRAILAAGRPAIADATFLLAEQRAPFIALAEELQVPVRILDCQAPEATLRERIARRLAEGADPSEADMAVLGMQLSNALPLSAAEQRLSAAVDTRSPPPPAELARLLGLALLPDS